MQPSVSVVYVESNHMSQRKKTVIDLLREGPEFVSGEAISAKLGISRNAVHKHVNSLRKRGYRILGISRRGYKLEEEPARLSMARVTDLTEKSALGHTFRYYDEIESTNLEAKSLANSGAPAGTVVIAEAQSAGRGRLGRRWTSPAGKGLLFSVLLRPDMPMSKVHLLTLVAAVAAAEAIEAHADAAVHIKWPNDLLIGEKKVGGILMELAGEQDEVEWVIVGIGVNVNTEYGELPVSLRRTATSLRMVRGNTVDRSDLLAALLLSLEKHCDHAVASGFESTLSMFRQRDYLLHKSVSVQTREGTVVGAASGIDERGALLVELPHRRIRRFHSGDVTLRA
jgi:BirA family transcriptional regulator, biotin operon repressor / biotin---[acetyl-CoA-carboxylase] ligase